MLLRDTLISCLALGLGGALLLVSCEKKKTPEPEENSGQLGFRFENVVGNQPLTFGQLYSTAAGEQFTVSKFNYFITNIKLTKADGSVWAEPESYYLVKQDAAGSQQFTVKNIPSGDYTRVAFTIGVDSARNTAGAQNGALDVGNDMYWDWNSGYIFLKLEGTSPQSRTGQLSYHIGGFRRPFNAIRTVSPALPAGITALTIRPGTTPEVRLKADALNLFRGVRTIRFAQNHTTGHGTDSTGVRLAMNAAAGMFRIDHVH
jgi:hypothetical protein